MARKILPGTPILRRTAGEVRRYRHIMRVTPPVIAAVALFLVLIYVITILYSRYGAFTVTVNKFDNLKYALTLSETADFASPTSRLNNKAAEEVTNIDGDELPDYLDNVDGSHNGKNYVAYTFYCRNEGSETVTYEYQLFIANMTENIERAVRVRLYVNGVSTDYAHTATDGSGAEPGTVEFYNKSVVARTQINNFMPGDITKYTVVIWIEGKDPDCVDNIIGGVFKVDMNMTILGVEEN